MRLYLSCIPLALLSIVASGCASSDHLARHAKNQFVIEFYALVEDVKKIKFKSHVGEAAAIGALDGIVGNVHGDKDDMLAGAIIGGLFGGLITAIIEGDNSGYEYQLAAIDGDFVNVIVNHDKAGVGECVKVRISGDVRVYPHPMIDCDRARINIL